MRAHGRGRLPCGGSDSARNTTRHTGRGRASAIKQTCNASSLYLLDTETESDVDSLCCSVCGITTDQGTENDIGDQSVRMWEEYGDKFEASDPGALYGLTCFRYLAIPISCSMPCTRLASAWTLYGNDTRLFCSKPRLDTGILVQCPYSPLVLAFPAFDEHVASFIHVTIIAHKHRSDPSPIASTSS